MSWHKMILRVIDVLAHSGNRCLGTYQLSYRKAADFAKSNPGFDQESIDRYLSEVKRMRNGK